VAVLVLQGVRVQGSKQIFGQVGSNRHIVVELGYIVRIELSVMCGLYVCNIYVCACLSRVYCFFGACICRMVGVGGVGGRFITILNFTYYICYIQYIYTYIQCINTVHSILLVHVACGCVRSKYILLLPLDLC